VVKPVAQPGSAQLTDGQLAKNPDGSLTLWFSPSLPAGVAASNGIPTPSTAYFNTIYPDGSQVSTNLQLILRMYYPTPGNQAPSILPESYLPPVLQLVNS